MQITLKKAAELSRAVIAAAKATEIKSSFTVSAFSTDDVADLLAKARADFAASLAKATKLMEVGYTLRAALAKSNADADIDLMLTGVAEIDEKIKIITAAMTSEGVYNAEESNNLSTLQRRVESARKDIDGGDRERRRYGATIEGVVVMLLGDTEKAECADLIATLKRRRATLKDGLTGANFNTKIELSADTEATLRAEKLID